MEKNLGTTFSLPEELGVAAAQYATSLGMSVSGLLTLALSAYLSAHIAVGGSRRVLDAGRTDNGALVGEPSERKAVMSASEWVRYQREVRSRRKVVMRKGLSSPLQCLFYWLGQRPEPRGR
jgi:hypothetical protein